MVEIRPLRVVQDEAAKLEVRRALEDFGDVAHSALLLDCHENTVRFYMKRIGITPENVREWKNQRMRQRTMQFNGK